MLFRSDEQLEAKLAGQISAIVRAMAVPSKKAVIDMAACKCPACGGDMMAWSYAGRRRIRCNGKGCVRFWA